MVDEVDMSIVTTEAGLRKVWRDRSDLGHTLGGLFIAFMHLILEYTAITHLRHQKFHTTANLEIT